MKSSTALAKFSACAAVVLALFDPQDAFAYTEVCTGIQTVYSVRTEVEVPAGDDFVRFVESLKSFANKNGYILLSDEQANESGRIYVILQKGPRGDGITIYNDAKDPTSIYAESAKCGSESFRPYWKQFMSYLKQYMFAQSYYPSFLKPRTHQKR